MVEQVEVSVIHCGAREAIIGETLCKSHNYKVKLNVFGNYTNPFLNELVNDSGGKYYIIDTNDESNYPEIVEKCSGSDLVSFGNETPIIKNLGWMLRHKHGGDVGVIGPNSAVSLEKSKYDTRLILEEVSPQANPEFYYIDPKKIGWEKEAKKAVKELNGKVAIKPIESKYGKGVIVEGYDFAAKEAYQKAIDTAKAGPFLIEEKVIGQECSGQFAVDSNLNIQDFPYSRDFKRSEEKDKGPNTGGMAYFNGSSDILPFMSRKESNEGKKIVKKVKRKLADTDGYEEGSQTGIFYPAFTLTGNGIKVLEFNDRHGDPEALALRTLENDIIDVYFRMVEGNVPRLKFKKQAVAGIYAAPLAYSGYMEEYGGSKIIKWNEKSFSQNTKIYPGAIDLQDNGEMHIMKSRSVLVASMAPTLEKVFEIVNKDIKKIDGPVRHRTDVDTDYVRKCCSEMLELRRKFN